MGAAFLRVLNMSITASWLIAAVVLLRFLLKKAPRWIFCVLWAFVAVRLICPFSLESAWSLVPDNEPVSGRRMSVRDMPQAAPVLSVGPEDIGNGNGDEKGVANGISNAMSGSTASGDAQNSRMSGAGEQAVHTDVPGAVWICGAAAMIFYGVLSYRKLHKRTAASALLEGRIWQCDGIQTPFILGIVRPRIYLPSDLEGAQTEYVIAHEKTHLRRRDHWWKPLGFLILSVHWFNPLCWVSYILLCRDIELACDESVIRTADERYKKSYAEALVVCSAGTKRVAACPLAFGEVGVKERVRNVMNYKKPAFWIVLAAAAACLVVAVCFFTDPQKKVELQVRQEQDGHTAGAGDMDGPEDAGGQGNALEPGVGGQGSGAGIGADERGGRTDTAGAGAVNGNGGQTYDAAGIPDAVWEAAQGYVQSAFDRTKENAGQSIGGSYTEWRIQNLEYCYTYDQIAGMTCDIYRLNYEFLAEPPEDIVLTGGMSQPEDGWVMPGSPNSHYLIFVIEGNTLSYFYGMYENDCEPGDELFTSDLIDYCLEMGMFDESEGFNPNGEELIRRFREVDVETLHTVPYTQDITGDYTGVGVDVTRADGSTCRAEILCLAELPDQGIRLYGYNDDAYWKQGVAVEIGEEIFYYDWGYMTPRIQFPKLYWDEKKRQLQLTLPIYTGTSFAAEKLVVLQYDGEGALKPYYFGLDEFTALINSILGYRYDETEGKLTLMDKRTEEEAASVLLPGEAVYGIWSGDISEFVLGETIRYRVTPGYLTDVAAPQYDGMPSVEFEVETMDDDGTTFTLGALYR